MIKIRSKKNPKEVWQQISNSLTLKRVGTQDISFMCLFCKSPKCNECVHNVFALNSTISHFTMNNDYEYYKQRRYRI